MLDAGCWMLEAGSPADCACSSSTHSHTQHTRRHTTRHTFCRDWHWQSGTDRTLHGLLLLLLPVCCWWPPFPNSLSALCESSLLILNPNPLSAAQNAPPRTPKDQKQPPSRPPATSTHPLPTFLHLQPAPAPAPGSRRGALAVPTSSRFRHSYPSSQRPAASKFASLPLSSPPLSRLSFIPILAAHEADFHSLIILSIASTPCPRILLTTLTSKPMPILHPRPERVKTAHSPITRLRT